MTSLSHFRATGSVHAATALAVPVFGFALFLSAFLIFSVQPMFAKMVLPLLGGAPAVWNAAMVFFQASLLAGYLYAHLLCERVPVHRQSAVHAAVMTVGALFLPFAVNGAFLPRPDQELAPAVIVLCAVSIGFPFFALSANAPLLQSWFARTRHRDAADPYFLYGMSNLGSVLALLAYPVAIEPILPLGTQTVVWAAGYALLAVAILAATGVGRRLGPGEGGPAAAAAAPAVPAAPVSWGLRLRWIAAAAIPSSLMLGVTTTITTNLAAAPFLWVLPLALYLLTFILVFDRKGIPPIRLACLLHTVLLVAVLLFPELVQKQVALGVAAHLALFFVSALICHADLAARRPAAARLTDFYLCMSAGGVLGGGITALCAPLVFPTVLEYPLMLAAACLFLPGAVGRLKPVLGDLGFAAGAFALAATVAGAGSLMAGDVDGRLPYAQALLLVLSAAYFLARRRPVRAAATAFAVVAVTSVLVPHLLTEPGTRLVSLERSFFGVSKVEAIAGESGLLHRYAHGDTIHNMQLREPGLRHEPLAYYAFEGPFGDILRAARAGRETLSVGAIGLGAGALACHAAPGDNWTFYEIDPAVVRMAGDPSRFSYLADCSPDARIVLGDGRLAVEREPERAFDLVIVDAFSSDSIPAHLMTVEAIELYRRKLKPQGLLFLHVSNRYADVGSVAVAAADALGLGSRHIVFKPGQDVPAAAHKLATAAVAIAEEPVLAGALDGVSSWRRVRPNPAVGAWTDDWSDIFGAMIARVRGGPVAVDAAVVAEK